MILYLERIWRKVGFSILIKTKDALINDNKGLTIAATALDGEDESFSHKLPGRHLDEKDLLLRRHSMAVDTLRPEPEIICMLV